MRENKIYVSLYLFWSKFIFIEFIPYTTILIMNIFIMIKITKSARFRKKFLRQGNEEEVDVENHDLVLEDEAEVNLEDPEAKYQFFTFYVASPQRTFDKCFYWVPPITHTPQRIQGLMISAYKALGIRNTAKTSKKE